MMHDDRANIVRIPDPTIVIITERLNNGDILPIQIQLADALGSRAAMEMNLPPLKLRRHLIQWLLARKIRGRQRLWRVLRAATRSPEYGLPAGLSVAWGADCARRVVDIFERNVPGDDRPRHAIESARSWTAGECDAKSCRVAAIAANEAIANTTDEKAECAAYAARDAAGAIPGDWSSAEDRPKWMVADHAANYAGHAADWASMASEAPELELAWQKHQLIDAILSCPSAKWR